MSVLDSLYEECFNVTSWMDDADDVLEFDLGESAIQCINEAAKGVTKTNVFRKLE